MEYMNISERPSLRNPVMIGAFSGWNDAAGVATAAVRHLIESWSAVKFATVDPEEFYVFSETRPRVRLVGGTYRRIDWPANEFYYRIDPKAPRDYIFLVGVEPQLKWRTFSRLVLDMAKEYGVTKVVTLGGLLADVAHTMPARLTGSASEQVLQERLRRVTVSGSKYQGPTGIVGVLNSLYQEQGMPSASIWGNVPHYLTGTTNPKVTRELLRALDAVLGINVSLRDFDSAIAEFETQVAEAIAKNPEIATYVKHLEQREKEFGEAIGDDEEPGRPREIMPATDNLLKELEDFLRRRRDDAEPDQP